MRRFKTIAPAFVALALTPVVAQQAFAAADPTGIWVNDTGRGAVEIKPCGAKLCGNVVWVKAAKDSEGCGKQVMGEVENVGGGVWDNGWVYSPERGRKFDVELKPLNNGNLQVTGYAGTKFFSQTMIWTRAPQDLKLCGQTEAKAASPKADVATKLAKADAAPERARAPESVASVANDEPAPAKTVTAPAKKAVPTAPSKVDSAAKPDAALAPKAHDDDAAAEPKNDASPSAKNDSDDDDKNDSDDVKKSDTGGNSGKVPGGLKLGGFKLEKVLTKTGSGKCMLNTPWIKVQFHCEH